MLLLYLSENLASNTGRPMMFLVLERTTILKPHRLLNPQ